MLVRWAALCVRPAQHQVSNFNHISFGYAVVSEGGIHR